MKKQRVKMPLIDRAKQFAPFSALKPLEETLESKKEKSKTPRDKKNTI